MNMDFSKFKAFAEQLKGENVKIEIDEEIKDNIKALHRKISVSIPALLIIALAAIAVGIAAYINAPETGGVSIAVTPIVVPVVAAVFGSSAITAISISIAARNAFVLLKLKEYKFMEENDKYYLVRK